MVAGPAWGEDAIAHPLAVQFQRIQPVAGHVSPRPPHAGCHAELRAQHRRRRRLGNVLRQIGRDPGGLPIGRLQQAHFPPGRLTPRRGLARPIPHPHLPPTALARPQGRPRVGLERGLVRLYPAGVPQITFITGQGQALGIAGHQDLVGTLPHIAGLAGELPAQARQRHVEAEGVGLIFTRKRKYTDGRKRQDETLHPSYRISLLRSSQASSAGVSPNAPASTSASNSAALKAPTNANRFSGWRST